jgi:hypothetical protein
MMNLESKNTRNKLFASEEAYVKQLEAGHVRAWVDLKGLYDLQRNSHSFILGHNVALSISENVTFSDEEWQQLRTLALSDNPRQRGEFHQFLNFVKMYSETLLNITPDDPLHEDYERIKFDEGHGRETFKVVVVRELDLLVQKSKNFLVRAHIEDALDSFLLWNDEKKDSLAGVPGGARDDVIYAHEHLRESYDLRRTIGYYDGYLIAQTCLPFSKGVAAVYNDFSPEKMTPIIERKSRDEIDAEDTGYISENNPEHDWIYDAFHVPDPRNLGGSTHSVELEKLRILWKLDNEMEVNNEEYFFDLRRINKTAMHPFVYSDILHRNFEFLKKRHQTEAQVAGIETLFTGTSTAPDSQYALLTSLSMRKKVEEQLGIEYTSLSALELLWLLSFLENTPVDQVIETRSFFDRYGVAGARTFLSMEHDRGMGDKILELTASSADEHLKSDIFLLYGAIIDAGSDAASAALAEKMGKAARDVLAWAHQYKDEPEKIRKILEKISVEGQVLLGTFRALAGEKKVQAVTEVAGVEYMQLNGAEVLRDVATLGPLEELYRSNYGNSKTQETLIAAFRKNLGEPGALVHRILFRGKVVAFMLIVPKGEKKLHVSALNVAEELVGVKAGPELLKKVLDLVQEGNTIEAEATPELTERYEKQYGFKRQSKKPKLDVDGEPIFKLELRPPSKAPSSTAPQKEIGGENK